MIASLLLTVAALALIAVALLGLLLLFHVLRPQRAPADRSNRINKVRLVWFALTREELFLGTFPWLAHDELRNVAGEDRP